MVNEKFEPLWIEHVGHFELTVYNRWGHVLFTSFEDDWYWDGLNQEGNPAPDGTYYYILQYGLNETNPLQEKGYFQLIRQ